MPGGWRWRSGRRPAPALSARIRLPGRTGSCLQRSAACVWRVKYRRAWVGCRVGAQMSQAWERLEDRMAALRRRNLLAAGVRAFFGARGYCEVETPYVVAAPGEEVHLR